MTNRIPEDVIEKIRLENDIVEIVSEYVQLKKQGRNYFGLCPFHGENTPSFSVAPDKQIYHCFGCGAGGNVISFIMNIEGQEFPEALRMLAERANIALPQLEQQDKYVELSANTSDSRKAHELLKKFYHHLLVNTKEGRNGLEYLQARGFTNEAIQTFELGYAPDAWEATAVFLEKRGFKLEKMAETGILSKRQQGEGYYDRFRQRVMFPIWSHRGEVIAFGGRALGEGNPKYLNSPETDIFKKGQTLYGFHLARKTMRKESTAVLFEGYADVISAWSAGIRNGIATLGTSLTEEQAQILHRVVDTVVICYDSDDAGMEAADRAATILQRIGCQVKVAVMPDGMDPDDYIRKHGSESFRKSVIGASLTYMSYKMRLLRKGKNLQEAGDRIQYIEETLQEITNLSKAVEREHYLKQLADEFSMSFDTLKDEQHRIYRQMQKSKGKQSVERNSVHHHKILTGKKLLPAFHNAERYLLAHMIQDPYIAEKIQDEIGCSFNIDAHNAIAIMLYAYYADYSAMDISKFMQRIEDEDLRSLVSELAMLDVNSDVSEQELSDYIRRILDHPKWKDIYAFEQEKKEAERRQEVERAAQIAMQIIELKKQLKHS